MDLTLNGKVAIITGGSRGLGRQCALALGREGCAVGICGRDGEQVGRTVAELQGLGIKASGSQADVTKDDECARFLRETTDALGAPDILVNNVGGRRGSVLFDETSMEQFLEGLEVNLISAVRMTKLALPHMQTQGWGRVINIASIYGREHGGSVDYMTGKAGMIAFSKHLALQLAQTGVLVNCVAPGSIDFPGSSWDRFQQNNTPEVVAEFIDRNLPMGKFGWPEPIGETVAFLASDRAGLITGACINVDGGQSKSLF
ncbi:MAG: SDR family NAD(P)-dependent oxidoreductase [Chloroflexota bacterium]|nr:SDR family NAD(P)-dependent oxidoreductase [Chloroflexota bacterium]MDE2683866.1 SDR family NAD(P)-dependent oxidoreductase [Chloroflexota bacterium]